MSTEKLPRINKSDEHNPTIQIFVDGFQYGHSVQMLSTKDQQWLLSVLPRQMQEIHDRAVKKTKDEFQKNLRDLAGL